MDTADARRWCGVDIGTTNVKAVVIAADGRVLARASAPTPRVPDALGPCTDADQLFDLVEALVLQAWQSAGATGALAALCCGGVGEDGVLLDAALRPLEPAIPWNDRRAADQAQRLAGSPLWRAANPAVPMELTRTAAKWAWLHAHRPDVVRAASLWVALTDYPAMRWTQRAFMSRTLATRTACYDLTRGDWIAALLADCHAPPLPPVLSGGAIVGQARSARLAAAGAIDDATAVIAGGHDHPMAASLVCGGGEGAILDSMGTAELVYVESHGATAPDPLFPDPFFNASAAIIDANDAWLGVSELSRMLEPMLAPGHALRTLFAAVMDGAAIPGSIGAGGLVFRPGDDTATFAPHAPPAQRLRAVLEASGLLNRSFLRRADRLAGAAAPGPVYVAGGWARSDTFLQLRADIAGRPVRRIEEPQLSAVGSACLAARGTGVRLPFALAARIFTPDPDSARRYDALFEAAGPELEERHLRSLGMTPPAGAGKPEQPGARSTEGATSTS